MVPQLRPDDSKSLRLSTSQICAPNPKHGVIPFRKIPDKLMQSAALKIPALVTGLKFGEID